MTGYVYIVSNPAYSENYVKIGRTDEPDVRQRIRALGSTSVPRPFEIVAVFACEDSGRLEEALHRVFEDKRVANNREFFQIDPKTIEFSRTLLSLTCTDLTKFFEVRRDEPLGTLEDAGGASTLKPSPDAKTGEKYGSTGRPPAGGDAKPVDVAPELHGALEVDTGPEGRLYRDQIDYPNDTGVTRQQRLDLGPGRIWQVALTIKVLMHGALAVDTRSKAKAVRGRARAFAREHESRLSDRAKSYIDDVVAHCDKVKLP